MDNISPVYARFVLREVLRLGIPAEDLLANTSLSRDQLESGGDLAMEDFLTILENGRSLTDNDMLGLVIGRHSNIMTLGEVGAAAAIAPTVRAGLQAMASYSLLHISYTQMELLSELDGLTLRFDHGLIESEVKRFHAEATVMLVQQYVEMLSGEPLTDASYRLGIEAPSYKAEYRNWLHSEVSFGGEQTIVKLPSATVDLPSPYYNTQMWKQAAIMLASRLRELEREQGAAYTHYVRALLRSCEPPLPDLASVAERIHTSARTLNRRLQSEGISFREIKNEVQGSWARRHLSATNNSVEVIAAELGYRDTANFRRAFRKLQGCSPAEFRQQVRDELAAESH